MSSTFNPQILIEKLTKLNASQTSIETLSHWCTFHMNKAKNVVETWHKQFHCSPRDQRLPFLYLANDILQNSRRKGADFVAEFWKVLPDALRDVIQNGDASGKNQALRLINIWDERKVFGSRGHILKDEFVGIQPESSAKIGRQSSFKLRQSAGSSLDNIVSGYEVIYGGQVDKDVIFRQCADVISSMEKAKKDVSSNIAPGVMEGGNPVEEALVLLRSRICNPNFIFSALSSSPDSNYSKLKFIISGSVTEACNNSVLLLGPRGCGKTAVLELVLKDLLVAYPDMISVIRLNGLLHSDDNCALKEISRQLCSEHELMYSKMASSDDNCQFMVAMLRECGLAHKTIVFVLDEFDLFTQGKQRLLYSILDALQSVTSQAVVIGISCRLDADQLLEKRVRSRFSHRKLLFSPPAKEDLPRLLEHVLSLPEESTLPREYAEKFNKRLHAIMVDTKFKDIINRLSDFDSSAHQLLRLLFMAASSLDLKSGLLSVDNFSTAILALQKQPKLDCLKECSILELYILVCMKRLETREQNSYNFNSIMKEYKAVHDSFPSPDYYARSVCLRAFQHLIQCELIGFTDNRGYNQSVEFRPVKILVSPFELHQGLKSNNSCPSILQRLFDQSGQKS